MSENLADEYRRLRSELNRIEELQKQCNHTWVKKTKFERKPIIKWEYAIQGSDPYWKPIYTGNYETVPVNYEECTKCGKTRPCDEKTQSSGYGHGHI